MSMLLWFRNDLRTHDNPALAYVLSQAKATTPTKAIFFISEPQWRVHDWSSIKIDFVKRHALSLIDELASLGICLEIVHVDSFSAQVDYLLTYCQQKGIDTIVANSELEFNEQQRDLSLQKHGINLTLFESDVIAPKGKVLNQSGSMFKVFTPFKKAWLAYVNEFGFDYLGKPQNGKQQLQKNTEPSKKRHQGASKAWPLAPQFEQDVLPVFMRDKLSQYAQNRDIPSIKGTSALSPYLAAGVISPRYLLRLLIHHSPDILQTPGAPAFAWLNEIIWREFYRHLIFHYPKLCKHHSFKEKYRHTLWHNDLDKFNAWKTGRTGYPLVDAAMRQLNATGWMHNRLRMVVASFLTKHLLIDWRWGEKYFMQTLIDGDLAANNGGWQWAASTGCDAQPYFRIFNPIKQSERFDPNGDFIRIYLPELASVPDKHIHFPHQYIKKNQLAIYWPAMVEHKTARAQALAFYQ